MSSLITLDYHSIVTMKTLKIKNRKAQQSVWAANEVIRDKQFYPQKNFWYHLSAQNIFILA